MTEFSSKESNERYFDAYIEKLLSKEEEIKNGAVEYTKLAPDKMINQDTADEMYEALKSALPYLQDGHGINGVGIKSKAESAIKNYEKLTQNK